MVALILPGQDEGILSRAIYFNIKSLSASHPDKIRNSDFYKKCMQAALLDLEEGDEEDPFDL